MYVEITVIIYIKLIYYFILMVVPAHDFFPSLPACVIVHQSQSALSFAKLLDIRDEF